jgi:hypothetical protein
MRRFTLLIAVAAVGFSQPSFARDVHVHTNDTPSGYGYGFPSFASPFNPSPLNERPEALAIGR